MTKGLFTLESSHQGLQQELRDCCICLVCECLVSYTLIQIGAIQNIKQHILCIFLNPFPSFFLCLLFLVCLKCLRIREFGQAKSELSQSRFLTLIQSILTGALTGAFISDLFTPNRKVWRFSPNSIGVMALRQFIFNLCTMLHSMWKVWLRGKW